jgi:hypothetical protein
VAASVSIGEAAPSLGEEIMDERGDTDERRDVASLAQTEPADEARLRDSGGDTKRPGGGETNTKSAGGTAAAAAADDADGSDDEEREAGAAAEERETSAGVGGVDGGGAAASRGPATPRADDERGAGGAPGAKRGVGKGANSFLASFGAAAAATEDGAGDVERVDEDEDDEDDEMECDVVTVPAVAARAAECAGAGSAGLLVAAAEVDCATAGFRFPAAFSAASRTEAARNAGVGGSGCETGAGGRELQSTGCSSGEVGDQPNCQSCGQTARGMMSSAFLPLRSRQQCQPSSVTQTSFGGRDGEATRCGASAARSASGEVGTSCFLMSCG